MEGTRTEGHMYFACNFIVHCTKVFDPRTDSHCSSVVLSGFVWLRKIVRFRSARIMVSKGSPIFYCFSWRSQIAFCWHTPSLSRHSQHDRGPLSMSSSAPVLMVNLSLQNTLVVLGAVVCGTCSIVRR